MFVSTQWTSGAQKTKASPKFKLNPFAFLKQTNLELYAFVDYAEAYTLADVLSNVVSSNSYLGSHGFGFRLNGADGLSLDFMAAKARNTFASADARGNQRYILSLTKSFWYFH